VGGKQLIARKSEINRRAVLPQPLQGVQLALLLMLHVHHDVDVVEQHPAVLSFSLATCTMGLVLVHGFVDSIYDRRDLTLVGRRDDNEDIGNGKMLRDIEGNDIEALLAKGSVRRYAGKLDSIFSGAQ
jgi:hypothetical protein